MAVEHDHPIRDRNAVPGAQLSGIPPKASQREPRILIENSEYWLSNVGDLAMMDVTIRRLRARWPDARIGVLTDTPLLLRAFFPEAEPVDPRGSRAWSEPTPLARLCQGAGPRLVGPAAIGWVTSKAWLPQKLYGLRRKLRKLLSIVGVGRHKQRATPTSASMSSDHTLPVAQRLPANTVRASATASLVIAMGGGYLTDADQAQSNRVLNLLEHSREIGIPWAMVGQGLGPIEEPHLLSRISEVLPHAGFIGLRESRRGPQLLERAGVPPANFAVTGDDAIELAYALRRADLGSDIGICLRKADYSPVQGPATDTISAALRTVAQDVNAGLVPVFIAEYKSQDRRSTLPLVRGYDAVRPPLRRFARPQEVAEQIGLCRVLVTGAYHAAVFALAQGIPVVALSSTAYYEDKFLGLLGMFGGGLELVDLDQEDLAERLRAAIRSAWEEAPRVRSVLRDSAVQQIASSREGLERACRLV